MEYLDEMMGDLHLMLYSARWKGLRRDYVGRVMSSLVHPWLYKYPAHWYLEKINELLQSKMDLSTLVFEPESTETDEEIRGFLLDLAKLIEKEYLVGRSGRYATQDGTWVCTTAPSESIQVVAGDILPNIGGAEVVWMHKPDSPETAEDIIFEEFNTYYLPRTIWGRTKYKGPEEEAKCSVQRLSQKTSLVILPCVLELLSGMANDRDFWLTKQIETETEFYWTTDEKDWAWFVLLLAQIQEGLLESVR